MKTILPKDAARLMLNSEGKSLFITGAGVSTESGIPDYRGKNGRYLRSSTKPMTHQEFMGSETNRKRFWARSIFGYVPFDSAQPNRAHVLLHKLEQEGYILPVITQNVDRLHHRAGSLTALELHGRGDVVECQHCFASVERGDYQQTLESANREWLAQHNRDDGSIERTADGDAFFGGDTKDFTVCLCSTCARGIMKPAYVFFGGSVSKEVSLRANELVRDASLLFLVGSTAHTYSCYRLLQRARELNKEVIIVNQGDTRADSLASARYDEDSCGHFLQQVSDELL